MKIPHWSAGGFFILVIGQIEMVIMKQERIISRVVGADSTTLLDWFDQDVRNGMNDELTKSCLYAVMNRYFQNGGNIYEISGYVNDRPSLTFLRKASVLYPALFQLISDRELPSTASPGSLLAYLAYLEVLERNGYAGVALRSTAAHQYAQLASIASQEPGLLNPGINVTQNILMKQNKALFFMDAAQEDIALIVSGQANTISIHDSVSGLRHYAVALRYLDAMGVEFRSPKTAREIFAVCARMIRENETASLGPFSGLLDASSLLFDAGSSFDEVRAALHPILEMEPNVQSKRRCIRRILLAKEQALRMSDKNSQLMRRREFGVFGKRNILSLAQKVPEFRVWLKDGGWTEADFEEQCR